MDERENLLLPIANVGRIMKKILPPNAKLSKEAKERMQECASEFISFVTGEASHKCHNENRKTLNGDDICCALTTLGFEDYSEAMTRYLNRFREFEMCKCKHRTQKCRKGFHSEEKDEESCSYRSIEQETTNSAPRSSDFGIVEKKTL